MSLTRAENRLLAALDDRYRTDIGIISGEVTSVDEDQRTCTVVADELELEDVQLQSLREESSGVVLLPSIGSTVLLLPIGNPDYIVLSATRIDKIIIAADTLIQIDGGENGGMPITGHVVQALATMQKDINRLKQAFTGWTPVAQDGGAALKAAVTTWAGQVLTETTAKDIENTKITH